jgi:hypothetical protein
MGKIAWGASTEKKMLINDERSLNVYENKRKIDNSPDRKSDISTQQSDIFYRSTRILLKPSACLSLFERWETNSSLQDAQTRVLPEGEAERLPRATLPVQIRRCEKANVETPGVKPPLLRFSHFLDIGGSQPS